MILFYLLLVCFFLKNKGEKGIVFRGNFGGWVFCPFGVGCLFALHALLLLHSILLFFHFLHIIVLHFSGQLLTTILPIVYTISYIVYYLCNYVNMLYGFLWKNIMTYDL